MNHAIYYIVRIGKLTPREGVSKKIEAQLKYIEKNSLNMNLVILTSQVGDISWADHPRVDIIIKNSLTTKEVINSIDEYLIRNNIPNDAIIYLRQFGSWSRSLHNFVKKHRVVFEHNTKEIDENILKINNIPGLRGFYIRLKHIPFFLLQKFYAKRTLKSALGGIAVTQELAEYEADLAEGHYDCRVVANGTDYPDEIMPKSTPITGKIQFAMLIGSYSKWHGIERLLESIRNVTYDQSFVIHIIGDVPEHMVLDIETNFSDSVKYHPGKSKQEIINFLDSVHCGIGTLALHTKNMEEACPLKVREYFAQGLPCLIGYIDTDISKKTQLDRYTFSVPNSTEPIDFSLVVQFIKEVFSNSNVKSEIYQRSKKIMHMEYKVGLLHNSILSIAEEK
jgi:hypothetical protein